MESHVMFVLFLQAQLSPDSFNTILNATVMYVSVLEPTAPGATQGAMQTLQKIGEMVMDTHPVGDVSEGKFFSVQPKFKVLDDLSYSYDFGDDAKYSLNHRALCFTPAACTGGDPSYAARYQLYRLLKYIRHGFRW